MDSDPETEDFFFESDHVALRGNRDYSNLLRTIAMLESCKMRVHEQLQELDMAQQNYLKNPDLLIKKLQNNESIINCKENVQIPELPKLIGTYEFLELDKTFVKTELDADETEKPPTVRGRIVDETKSETFNKLWTCEEQRRLEQLLIEFPPEQKEMRRYVKIARALGNRTPQQVSSRVQKYFQKLHDAGMPIPGRKPKNRRTVNSKIKYFHRPTTFFPSYNVPVNMPEDDEFEVEEMRMALHGRGEGRVTDFKSEENESTDEGGACSTSDFNEVETKLHHDKKLSLLKELRKEKETCGETYQPDPMAPLCDACDINAVTLKRWHCRTCHIYLNKCADCLISQIISNDFQHLSHDVIVED